MQTKPSELFSNTNSKPQSFSLMKTWLGGHLKSRRVGREDVVENQGHAEAKQLLLEKGLGRAEEGGVQRCLPSAPSTRECGRGEQMVS